MQVVFLLHYIKIYVTAALSSSCAELVGKIKFNLVAHVQLSDREAREGDVKLDKKVEEKEKTVVRCG